MDGITDVSYEEEEAMISFKMDSFQAFVLMQETYANLPFQSWELRPLGQDSAVFTVNGALFDLSIMIQVGDRTLLYTHQRFSQFKNKVCFIFNDRVTSVCCSQSRRKASLNS